MNLKYRAILMKILKQIEISLLLLKGLGLLELFNKLTIFLMNRLLEFVQATDESSLFFFIRLKLKNDGKHLMRNIPIAILSKYTN